jgi:hypothetical protein
MRWLFLRRCCSEWEGERRTSAKVFEVPNSEEEPRARRRRVCAGFESGSGGDSGAGIPVRESSKQAMHEFAARYI